MRERTPERISPEEHEQITRLAALCRRLLERAVGVAASLRPTARDTSPRAKVRSRLECVVHDLITPAARDLNAIAEAAARALEDEGQPE